ncbi:MAG: chloride channel protein [Bacteroidales bacterium]
MLKKEKDWLAKIGEWRLNHISERNFILLLGLLVGVVSGCAAVLLKNMIYYFGRFIINFFAADTENFLFLFLPLIGVALSFVYVKYVVKDDISHGVSRVLYAISKGRGRLKRSKMYSSLVASTITIGFGGSVGPEAPVVLSGAAIGSNVGRLFHVNYKTLVLLIACGSSGAIAGIFSAPIAGMIFALEVLMIDLTMSSLIPLLIASVTGATVSALLMGRSVLFHFDIQSNFLLSSLPLYLLLGIIAGFVSHYFLSMSERIEIIFSHYAPGWRRILIGGVLLSVLVFLFPPLYGEGFNFLADIFSGHSETLFNNTFWYEWRDNPWVFLGFAALIVFLKVIAMALTNGSGGVGGVFAPSMYVGAVLGLLVSHSLNVLFHLQLPEANFALAGMAAVMAGVMHAPLTAIFLVAEITGGYQFFIPLMIVSASSYLVNLYFNPHSIYTKKLAEKGDLFTHNKDAVVLSLMNIRQMVETNFVIVHPDQTLGDLVKSISRSSRNIFPVVGQEDSYLGVVFLDDVKTLIFRPELYNKIYVRELMFQPPCTADISETMDQIAHKFLQIPDYNIPILDGKTYIGFVSRANVFSNYRKKVKEMSND